MPLLRSMTVLPFAVALVACGSTLVENTAGTGGGTSTPSASSTSASSASSASSSHTSGSGGASPAAHCVPGEPPVQLVATNVSGSLDLDDDWVYFGASSANGCNANPAVLRVPKAGGAPQAVAAGSGSARSLVVAAGRVYWSDDLAHPCSSPDQGYTLYSAPVAGGPVVLLPLPPMAQGITDLAVDTTHLYFGTVGVPALYRAPLSAGPMELVAKVDAPVASGVAVDQNRVYWTTIAAAFAAPKHASATPQQLVATEALGLAGIAVDATDAYLAVTEACMDPGCDYLGKILRVSLASGITTVVVKSPNMSPGKVVLRGDTVYWTADSGDLQALTYTLNKAPKDGSAPPTEIAAGVGLAVDDTCVYWAQGDGGALWKAPR